MELTEYEECVDLMQFYEVYCSKESGVIEGNLGGWAVIFGTALAGLLVCWFADKKKPN